MKIRLLILLSCILLIVSTHYALENNVLFGGPKAFLNIDPLKISSLAIHFQEQKYVFKKQENDKWELTEPRTKEDGQSFFSVFFEDLTTLSITQTLMNNESGLKSYGLHDPGIKIIITHGSENKKTCLLFGNDNVAGTSFYAKIENSKEVLLLGKILKEDVLHIAHLLGPKGNVQ